MKRRSGRYPRLTIDGHGFSVVPNAGAVLLLRAWGGSPEVNVRGRFAGRWTRTVVGVPGPSLRAQVRQCRPRPQRRTTNGKNSLNAPASGPAAARRP